MNNRIISLHGPLVFNDCFGEDFCNEGVKRWVTKFKEHFPGLIIRAAAVSTKTLNGIEQWNFSINFHRPEHPLVFGPTVTKITFDEIGTHIVDGSDEQTREEVFKMLPLPKMNIRQKIEDISYTSK